jgi:iron complex transport system substrate-binding protein
MQQRGKAGWRAVPILLLLLSSLASARPAPALRIISLAPSATEVLFALGAGGEVVGISTYCDYPPEVARIDRAGTFLTPNIEGILAKHPDVVIVVPSPGNRSGVESLRRLGLNVVVVDPQTVAEIEESFVTIGRAVGREEAGRTLVRRVQERMERARVRVADAPERKVLMVVGHTPLIAVGAGTFQDELIHMARGVNLGARAGGQWPHLSLEFVIAAAPEVIIDTTMGNEERAGAGAALAFWMPFPTIPAVTAHRVFGYQAYQILRPGPRLAEAFETMAQFIHPERWASGDG